MGQDSFLIVISVLLFLMTIVLLARLWKRSAKERRDSGLADLVFALGLFLPFIVMTLFHAYGSNPDASIRFLVDLFILICFSMVFSVLIGNFFLSVCRSRRKRIRR